MLSACACHRRLRSRHYKTCWARRLAVTRPCFPSAPTHAPGPGADAGLFTCSVFQLSIAGGLCGGSPEVLPSGCGVLPSGRGVRISNALLHTLLYISDSFVRWSFGHECPLYGRRYQSLPIPFENSFFGRYTTLVVSVGFDVFRVL